MKIAIVTDAWLPDFDGVGDPPSRPDGKAAAPHHVPDAGLGTVGFVRP